MLTFTPSRTPEDKSETLPGYAHSPSTGEISACDKTERTHREGEYCTWRTSEPYSLGTLTKPSSLFVLQISSEPTNTLERVASAHELILRKNNMRGQHAAFYPSQGKRISTNNVQYALRYRNRRINQALRIGWIQENLPDPSPVVRDSREDCGRSARDGVFSTKLKVRQNFAKKEEGILTCSLFSTGLARGAITSISKGDLRLSWAGAPRRVFLSAIVQAQISATREHPRGSAAHGR